MQHKTITPLTQMSYQRPYLGKYHDVVGDLPCAWVPCADGAAQTVGVTAVIQQMSHVSGACCIHTPVSVQPARVFAWTCAQM